MWEVKIAQSYFDIDNEWAGQGYPVTLDSKFGDTEATLAEIRDFLKAQGDEKPLTVDTDDVEFLWNEARKDMTRSYELPLRTDPYEPTGPNDQFDGTVQIHLWLTYNIEEAKKKQTPLSEPPENKTEPKQLNLF